jgi:hypothetical protein
MYNNQQALVTAAISRRLQALEQAGSLDFFPVRLRDAAKLIPTEKDLGMWAKLGRLQQKAAKEPWSQLQALSLFGLIRDIPTDFVLSNQEDQDLKVIVERLLDWKDTAGGATLAERFLRAVAAGAARRVPMPPQRAGKTSEPPGPLPNSVSR